MGKKLTGKALTKFEAERDVWQEVVTGVREIEAGGGKRTKVEPRSHVDRVRLNSGLSQAQFAAALGVSKRTLEQWEQGRREPSGAAKTLLRIAERVILKCCLRLQRNTHTLFRPSGSRPAVAGHDEPEGPEEIGDGDYVIVRWLKRFSSLVDSKNNARPRDVRYDAGNEAIGFTVFYAAKRI